MKSILIILTVFFSIGLFSQDIKTDAVYEKITKEYTLNEDGSVVFHYYKKLKLNTHFSFNRLYGETFIVYNPQFQTLKINMAKTTQESGLEVSSPENAFNEVLPFFANNAPYYNGLREMVVTHAGLEVGAVIELDYTLTSKPGFFPGLMEDEVLSETSPINKMEIVIHVPAGKELKFKVMNLRTGPEITDTKSGKTYTFLFSGLKENSHEPFQPGNNQHLPRLVFSTLSFAEAINAVTQKDAFSYKVNDDMKKLVAETKEKSNNEVELILELQKIVSGQLNTYSIPPKYTGFTIRTGLETWQSNGGTPCEKTILLIGLLREAGIYAKPLVVVPAKLYDESIGCLNLIENIIVQASPHDSELMYISAIKENDQNMVFDLNTKTLLLFEPSKQMVENIQEKFENKVVTNGTFEFNDSLYLKGNIEILLTEGVNPYYAIKQDSGIVKSFINGISDKDIHSLKVINSAQYRTLANLSIKSEKPLKNQAGYYFFELPVNKKGTDSWHVNYLHSERSDPFEIPFVVNEQYSYEISLSNNITLINPVDLIQIKTGFGELVISTERKENKIIVKRMLVINQKEITVKDYTDFKNMMDLWNDGNKRKLVLKK